VALNERGRDVLFVDSDPQGNATEGLGLVGAYDAQPPTIFDVLTDSDSHAAINDIVVEHDEHYCLGIDFIEEILKEETITRVPNTPAFVEGSSTCAARSRPPSTRR